MKYGSLKKKEIKVFNSGSLNGGLDTKNSIDSISDNSVSHCINMWFKDSYLKTRPGFKSNPLKAVDSKILGYNGTLEYSVTNTSIYRNNRYFRIATSNVFTDDYACYVYTYLIDRYGNMETMGQMAFLRFSSDVFFLPISLNFYSGKPQNGGGVFALVTLANKYNSSQKNYYIYEINSDFNEWERVYDYYIPTVLINGRGNNYQTAKTETGFSSPNPTICESQNMLDGKFYAYYTADGYSSSFKFPFNNIDGAEIRCKIYYTVTDYVEWVIPGNKLRVFAMFNDKEIAAIVNREIGLIYFRELSSDFPIPICGENNIKITASKEVENGMASIVNSYCVSRNNSKLFIAGGKNGNTVYSAEYDNPLYFPKDASVEIGESNSSIVCLATNKNKILAFKEHSLYLLNIRNGGKVAEITLLNDNDKQLKKSDSFTCEEISKQIGCTNFLTEAFCNGEDFWLSENGKIYSFNYNTERLKEVYDCSWLDSSYFDCSEVSAFGGEKYYMLIYKNKILVLDISESQKCKAFLWEAPLGLNVKSGFYHSGKYLFLCTDNSTELAFVATLEGNTDSVLYYGENDTVEQKNIPVKSALTTKYYRLDTRNTVKNINSISFLMSAKSRVKISVNNCYRTELNFGYLNEDYDKSDYKTVRLSPHIYDADGVVLSIESDNEIGIGDIEIGYKVTG